MESSSPLSFDSPSRSSTGEGSSGASTHAAHGRVGVTFNPPASTSRACTPKTVVMSSLPVPSNLASLQAVAALERGIGFFVDIDRPTPFLSVLNDANAQFFREMLGPSAEIVLDKRRAIYDPLEGGYIGVSLKAIRLSFRVPPPSFFSLFCRYYSVVPGQLFPNAFRIISGFLTLCHHHKIAPSIPLFSHLLHVGKVGEYVMLSQRDCQSFLGGLESNIKKWKDAFLFVRPSKGSFQFPTAWPQTYYQLAKPKNAAGQLVVDIQTFSAMGECRVGKWMCIRALDRADFLPAGAAWTGLLRTLALPFLPEDNCLGERVLTFSFCFWAGNDDTESSSDEK